MSNHRVMISTVTGYDKNVIPTRDDIDEILETSPNCTINFFANSSSSWTKEEWNNELLIDAAKDTIDYAKSLGVVIGTSAVNEEAYSVLQKGVGLCQCSVPCIVSKATPIALCIQILDGVASAVLWNGYGGKYTADVTVSGKDIVLRNIRTRGSTRDFPDGVTPGLSNIYPYTLTAVPKYNGTTPDVDINSVSLGYSCRITVTLSQAISELDTNTAKRIFVKFVYGI